MNPVQDGETLTDPHVRIDWVEQIGCHRPLLLFRVFFGVSGDLERRHLERASARRPEREVQMPPQHSGRHLLYGQAELVQALQIPVEVEDDSFEHCGSLGEQGEGQTLGHVIEHRGADLPLGVTRPQATCRRATGWPP